MEPRSLFLGAALGVATMYALDKWGRGTHGVLRIPNPNGPLQPQVLRPGESSRLPQTLEDYLRGSLQAGARVLAESAGLRYVIEEVQGPKKRSRRP